MDTLPESEPLSTSALSARVCRGLLQKAIAQHDQARAAGPADARRHGDAYRRYGELLVAIEELAEAGARVALLGRSVGGEPLFGVCLGAPAGAARPRTAVIVSGLHPLERIGIEVHLALLRKLAATDLGARAVLGVVVANPDGALRVDRDLRAGRRRLSRHNARGVDLNRNFPTAWGRRGLRVIGPRWPFQPGHYPSSEPEVTAVTHALGRRRVDRAVSLHSFGPAVLYPAACSLRSVPDVAEQRRWARHVAARMAESWAPALPAAWLGLGLVGGGLELDWFHQRHGALSLLVQCAGGLTRSPASWLDPFAWYNPSEPARHAERIADALMPFVRGDAEPPA